MQIRIKREGLIATPIPCRQTPGAAAVDLHAAIDAPYILQPHTIGTFPTGWSMEIPEGYEGQIRGRSGHGKKGVLPANGIGTIDSDFRGHIHILLVNVSSTPYRVEPLERIAQMVFARVERPDLVESDALTATLRGAGGFGSTT